MEKNENEERIKMLRREFRSLVGRGKNLLKKIRR